MLILLHIYILSIVVPGLLHFIPCSYVDITLLSTCHTELVQTLFWHMNLINFPSSMKSSFHRLWGVISDHFSLFHLGLITFHSFLCILDSLY